MTEDNTQLHTPPSKGHARGRVHAHVHRQLRRFPDLDIGGVDTRDLEPRDAHFAKALEHAVVRRWITLEAIAASQVNRPWETLDAHVQAALMIGTAQILFMDNVPVHAAINESVNVVRSHIHVGATGLVNAVLRSISRLHTGTLEPGHPDAQQSLDHRNLVPMSDGSALVLAQDVFDQDPVIRLVEQTSHGEDLVIHWISAHGLARTQELCLHDLVVPSITLTASDPDSIRNGPVEPHSREGFFVWKGVPGELGVFLAAHPGSRVQDPASAEPIAATSVLSPKLIVDYCAGRGTKTHQLAEIHPEARIIASDIDHGRRHSLREAFAHHPRVDVVEHGDFRDAIGKTDLLLLDVPCTNTGVLPRRPEAKYRFGTDSLKSLAQLQRTIVRETQPLLAPDMNRLIHYYLLSYEIVVCYGLS